MYSGVNKLRYTLDFITFVRDSNTGEIHIFLEWWLNVVSSSAVHPWFYAGGRLTNTRLTYSRHAGDASLGRHTIKTSSIHSHYINEMQIYLTCDHSPNNENIELYWRTTVNTFWTPFIKDKKSQLCSIKWLTCSVTSIPDLHCNISPENCENWKRRKISIIQPFAEYIIPQS